jgi:hypothetical protein
MPFHQGATSRFAKKMRVNRIISIVERKYNRFVGLIKRSEPTAATQSDIVVNEAGMNSSNSPEPLPPAIATGNNTVSWQLTSDSATPSGILYLPTPACDPSESQTSTSNVTDSITSGLASASHTTSLMGCSKSLDELNRLSLIETCHSKDTVHHSTFQSMDGVAMSYFPIFVKHHEDKKAIEPHFESENIVLHNSIEKYSNVDNQINHKATQEHDKAKEDATEEHKEDRNDWKKIRGISDDSLRRFLLDCFDDTRSFGLNYCIVLRRSEGTYNLAVVMAIARKGKLVQYVVRIPAHGTAELWTDADRYMLEHQVQLMKQIDLNCILVPVPRVFSYSADLDNPLGVPYILMEKLEGQSATTIWFDDPDDDCEVGSDDDFEDWQVSDCPSAQTHHKRVNFLNSLADVMVNLNHLKFDKIGLPIIPTPYRIVLSPPPPEASGATVGHTYHWPSSSDIHKVVELRPFQSTQDYLKAGLDKKFNYENLRTHPKFASSSNLQLDLGVRKLLDIVISTSAFNPNKEPEDFVIRHTDLDLQNILVNEDGKVTGIIDWDGAIAAPRCIGPTAVPMFLQDDWYPDDEGDDGQVIERSPYMSWNTEYYRNIYSAATTNAEATYYDDSLDSATFTSKSPIYQAAFDAIYEGGNAYDFTDRILREIPGFRADPYTFKIKLGKGWPAAEEMLRREIPKICEPVGPTEKSLRELDILNEGDDTEEDDSEAENDEYGAEIGDDDEAETKEDGTETKDDEAETEDFE